MNWKLVASLSAFGVLMGFASVLGWTGKLEGPLWIAIGSVCAVVIARSVPDRHARHGFLVGMFGAMASQLIAAALMPTYLANNPNVAAELSAVPAGLTPQTLFLLAAPHIGLVSGLVLALVSTIAARLIRGRAMR